MMKIRNMNNLKQTLKIRMPSWQILWRITGVLVIILGIVGIATASQWADAESQGLTMPEGIPDLFPAFVASMVCGVTILVSIIMIGGRFWQRYPRVIILYFLSTLTGFSAIGWCYSIGNDTAFETAVSGLGMSIVILTGLTIFMRKHSATGEIKYGKPALLAAMLALLLFVLCGYVFPQRFDAAASSFPDTKFRAVIRDEVGKTFGWIQQSDLREITYINARSKGVVDISGVEKCVSLKYLRLDLNYYLSDITPLASLINITELDISSCDVKDITSLSGLIRMEHLNLCCNEIEDISSLSNMFNAYMLDLSSNAIEDVSALRNLSNLSELDLGANKISDISPLSNISTLIKIAAYHNNISDISSLLENDGLGAGDSVYLQDNPLSETSLEVYISQLQQRGVDVEW